MASVPGCCKCVLSWAGVELGRWLLQQGEAAVACTEHLCGFESMCSLLEAGKTGLFKAMNCLLPVVSAACR